MAWLEDNQDELEGKMSLDRVLGDSYGIELLRSAIPHSIYNKTFQHPDMQSFLIYGESGCGKKTLAYALGKDLQYEGYTFINIDAVELVGEKVKKTRDNISEFFMEVIDYFSEEEEDEDSYEEEEDDLEEDEEESDEESEDSEYEDFQEEDVSEKKLCILIKGLHLLCKDEVSTEMIKTYLEYLEGMEESISCVFLATTSKIEGIPVSLRKSMVLCPIDLPSVEARSEYLKNLITKKKLYVDYLLTPQKMAEATEGYDYKKLSLLVKNMEMMLKREFIKWSKQKTDDVKNNLTEGLKNKSCQVTQAMFDKIIENMKEPPVSENVATMPQGFVMPQQMFMPQSSANTNVVKQEQKEIKKQSFTEGFESLKTSLPEKLEF